MEWEIPLNYLAYVNFARGGATAQGIDQRAQGLQNKRQNHLTVGETRNLYPKAHSAQLDRGQMTPPIQHRAHALGGEASGLPPFPLPVKAI